MKTRTHGELTKITNLLHLIANKDALIVCGYLSGRNKPPTIGEISQDTGLALEAVEVVVSTLTGLDVLMAIDEWFGNRSAVRLIFNPAMNDVALAVISAVWFEWFDNAKFSIPAATAPIDIEHQETAVFPVFSQLL